HTKTQWGDGYQGGAEDQNKLRDVYDTSRQVSHSIAGGEMNYSSNEINDITALAKESGDAAGNEVIKRHCMRNCSQNMTKEITDA
ncbi:hypothetical protein, partial [Xenorhabdus bovienii]